MTTHRPTTYSLSLLIGLILFLCVASVGAAIVKGDVTRDADIIPVLTEVKPGIEVAIQDDGRARLSAAATYAELSLIVDGVQFQPVTTSTKDGFDVINYASTRLFLN